MSLSPEKADTYTVGLVLTPTFVPDLNVTLDWYDKLFHNEDMLTAAGNSLVIALTASAASRSKVANGPGCRVLLMSIPSV